MRLAPHWRLTFDPNADPHAEAVRYELSGRREVAVACLKEAIEGDPSSAGLRNHLKVLQSSPPRSAPVEVVALLVGAHLAMAWGILIGMLVVLLCFPVWLAGWLFPTFMNTPAERLDFVILAVMALWATLAAVLTVRWFCPLWFKYLGLLPERYALAADGALPAVLTTWQLGKAYVRARQAFFTHRYGRPAGDA